MEPNIMNIRFIRLLKFLNLIFMLLLIVISCVMLFLFISLLVSGLLSEQTIISILKKNEFSLLLDLNGVKLVFGKVVLNAFQYDKNIIFVLFIISLIYTAIIFGIVFLLKKLIKSMIVGRIFTLNNSKRIEWISYSIVLLSITIETIKTLIFYVTFHSFQLDTLLRKSDLILSVNYHFFGINWSLLLCGLVVWTIGQIFRYGAFLQDEFDATA